MLRSSIVLAQCAALILALSAVAHAADAPNAADPPRVPAPAPRVGLATPIPEARGLPVGSGLTFASARLQDGKLVIRELRMVPERVQTPAGNSDVFRPLYEERQLAADQATFIRPKGQKLESRDVAEALAKLTPVLLARGPAALDPAYLELINPNAIVVVLGYHGRVPSFRPVDTKQE